MSKIVSLDTKVSARAMEAAMIAKLIKDLIASSPSAVVQQMVWRHEQLGEIIMDRPRAHPSFIEPAAALMRLEQYIDRLLYGERFVADKNPLIRISNARGMVCDLSLESFSLSALGDDGVMMLQFGRSEMPPGSRSALELKEMGRFALFHQPGVLLRRQQALLPMREIMESRKRHQELLEQQKRKAEEQEQLATHTIETILGASLPKYAADETMPALPSALQVGSEKIAVPSDNVSSKLVQINTVEERASAPVGKKSDSVLEQLESAWSTREDSISDDPEDHALDGLLELKAQLESKRKQQEQEQEQQKQQDRSLEALVINKDMQQVQDISEQSSTVSSQHLDVPQSSEQERIEQAPLAVSELDGAADVQSVLLPPPQLDPNVVEPLEPLTSLVQPPEVDSTTISAQEPMESPNPLADSNPIVMPLEVASMASSNTNASGGDKSAVAQSQDNSWHQVVFSIEVLGLSAFLMQVDEWFDYELRLTIKEQKVQMELSIPRGQLAQVSPIISKFKVGPIILKPKRIV